MFAAVIALLFLFLLFCKKYNDYKNYPPGPCGFPLVGYFPLLGDIPAETVRKLSLKYGDVVSLNLLGDNYLFLNSVEAIEEAFVKKGEIFAGRYGNEFNFYNLIAAHVSGTLEGEKWKRNLRFTVSHLSILGAGKSKFEYKIHEFLDQVEEYVASKGGKPNDYYEILTNFASNVIMSLCLSKDYRYDDPDYIYVRDAVHIVMASMTYMNFLLSGHGYWLYCHFFPTQRETMKTIISNQLKLKRYFDVVVNERMKNFDPKNCNDMLDYFLKESCLQNDDLFHKEAISEKIMEMFTGGTETTSAFLYQGLHLIASHENIQENCFKEINEKLGDNSLVSFADKDLLPYTNAVISEIQRFVCLVPLVTTHVSREATTLLNFNVPKRQKIIANFYAVSRNKKYFKNPDKFDPENFLDETGAYVYNKALIPFSTGIRKCFGAKLAEVDIFITFVRLMQTFKWRCSRNENQDYSRIDEGIIRMMQSNKLCAIRRKPLRSN